jgi:hypothetical protein
MQTTVAEGSLTFNASPPSPALQATLTDAQRVQILKDYAPLLLFSYDHDSDEKFAPIDIISFTNGAISPLARTPFFGTDSPTSRS